MVQVALVYPQIPPNTGNVARTCAATCTPLHLVEPLGFEISDRYLKRAGLDYWPYVTLRRHASLTDFRDHCKQHPGRWLGFTARGQQVYSDFEFQETDWLLFGSEVEGLPATALGECDETLRIPMNQSGVRSLNLSVSVAIGLFEALRQLKGGIWQSWSADRAIDNLPKVQS